MRLVLVSYFDVGDPTASTTGHSAPIVSVRATTSARVGVKNPLGRGVILTTA
jgi:hypothetical protein